MTRTILVRLTKGRDLPLVSITKMKSFEQPNFSRCWINAIQEYERKLGCRVTDFLRDDMKICPARENIFRCFSYFELQETKVVILGQDPYHTPGQATGLAFQCASSAKQPSLRNIEALLGHPLDFDDWAKKGVLLLNVALTTEEGKPGSHMKHWLPFAKYIIDLINKSVPNVLFVCWGLFARVICESCGCKNILVSSHPSPLSASKPLGTAPSFKSSDVFNKIKERVGLYL